MDRLFVRLQGATTGASLCDVTVVATPKTDAKTSRLVCHLTEIALTLTDCFQMLNSRDTRVVRTVDPTLTV